MMVATSCESGEIPQFEDADTGSSSEVIEVPDLNDTYQNFYPPESIRLSTEQFHFELLSAYPQIPLQGTVGTNLAKNSGFEEGGQDSVSGWTVEIDGSATVSRTAEYHARGDQSLHVTDAEGRAVDIKQQFLNRGHKTYDFRCLALSQSAKGAISIVAGYSLPGKPRVESISNSITGTNKNWQMLATRLEVPGIVQEFDISLRYQATENGMDGNVWFDDVELFNSKTPLHPNLLSNGDFASGPPNKIEDWGWWLDHSISRDSDKTFDNALKIDCKPGQGVVFMQLLDGRLQPDVQYLLRGYMKISAARAGEAHLEITRQNDAPIAATQSIFDTKWQWVEIQFKTPADVKGLLALLRFAPSGSASTNTVWFANVELFEVQP